MRNLNRMLLILASCTIVAAGVQSQTTTSSAADYGQDQDFANPEPLPFRSTPPQSYRSTSPQSFLLITDRHVFHNSQLPIVIDATPRVFIRTYNPDVGSYVDTEVHDPRCLMSCEAKTGH
jgi:hypothetical protein